MINKLKKILKNKLYRELDKKDITLRELRELQENGAIIIDVRSKQEYEEGHVDGSILIPEYENVYNLYNGITSY